MPAKKSYHEIVNPLLAKLPHAVKSKPDDFVRAHVEAVANEILQALNTNGFPDAEVILESTTYEGTKASMDAIAPGKISRRSAEEWAEVTPENYVPMLFLVIQRSGVDNHIVPIGYGKGR